MRDKRFITEHRGGSLSREQHNQLIKWACACVEHIRYLYSDEKIENALRVAESWREDKATVGEARKASIILLDSARELNDPVFISITRAAGHAVATAHMADHTLGAAIYSLKAIKLSGNDIYKEKDYQNKQLPNEIKELVLSTRVEKEKALKI